MATAEAPVAEGAQTPTGAAAPAPGQGATPSTPPPARPTDPSAATPPEGTPQAAAPEKGAEAAADADPYARVAELDPDELLQKHPRLSKRLGALADKQARQRVADERSKLAKEAQEQAERDKEALYQRAEQGDTYAEAQLLELTKRELGSKYGQRAVAEQLQQAEAAALWKVVGKNAEALGLDPDEEGLKEALGKDAKAVNLYLLGATRDQEAIEAMWSHPDIQKRHQAALEAVRAAATIDGQATAIRGTRSDLGTSGGSGRPQTPDDVIAEYAQVWKDGRRPSAELTEAYRRVSGRAKPAPPAAPAQAARA